MKDLCLLFIATLFSTAIFSQQQSADSAAVLYSDNRDTTSTQLLDSLSHKVKQRIFSPEEADSLVQQIEHLHTTLHSITNQSMYNEQAKNITKLLPPVIENLDIINQNLNYYIRSRQVKNLQTYRVLLVDMKDKLADWKATLTNNTRQLIRMQAEMRQFTRDSFIYKVAADSTFKKLYLNELRSLGAKWREAKSLTDKKLQDIEKTQASVSTAYFEAIELLDKVSATQNSTGAQMLAKEYNFIWEPQDTEQVAGRGEADKKATHGLYILLVYYLQQNWYAWAWMSVMAATFFLWVVYNFQAIKKSLALVPTKDNSFSDNSEFKYLHPIPVLATLIFAFNILPFMDFNPPALYIEIMQLALLISLTILFYRIWEKKDLRDWFIIFTLFVINALTNAFLVFSWPLRIVLLIVNVSSIVFGWYYLMSQKKDRPFVNIIRAVSLVFVMLNVASVICNIIGRVTLARLFTTSGILGLTQIIGLITLIAIIDETLYLQIKVRRIKSGHHDVFDYAKIQPGLNKILSVVGLFLWFMIFTMDLGIYDALAGFFLGLFNTPHKVGTIIFSWSNILIFTGVIIISSLLQKYISYFFGGTGEEFDDDASRKGSGIVIVRLVIIVGGFLLAVFASGLPIDKVTVVLGALGVGIGLGLQSIVNNLVSGLILIFEKPIQVGDSIEIGDKKGRVRDIGVRASKLLTTEGSELIVPNSDILSGHLVNWTVNHQRRTELSITIEPSTAIEAVKTLIQEELKANKYVVQENKIEILVTNISEKSANMKIQVWINNIYREQRLKSQILSNLYSKAMQQQIKISGN